MATELLAIGTTDADSLGVTVTAGSPVTVGLLGTDGLIDVDARLDVLIKDSDGNFMKVGELESSLKGRVGSLEVAGDYILRRQAGVSVGAWRS